MDINLDELFSIIGAKEWEIVQLRKQIAELQKRLAEQEPKTPA